jgi:hypothetical protein
MGTAGVAVAEAEVEAAEVRAEMVRKDGGRGSSSGSDGLELGWAEPDGMTESGMALKGWEGADGMGWDDEAAFVAPTGTELRGGKRGLEKEKHHKTIVCSIYSTFHPVESQEVGREGEREIGETLLEEESGILEGGRHTVSKAT